MTTNNKIEVVVNEIAEKRNELNGLTYNDSNYDDIEDDLHDLEDDFNEEFGTFLEDVLQDEKHPYRTHVAVIFMNYATQPLRSVEDVRALRKKYNAFINMCALLKKVTSKEKLVIYKGNKNG